MALPHPEDTAPASGTADSASSCRVLPKPEGASLGCCRFILNSSLVPVLQKDLKQRWVGSGKGWEPWEAGAHSQGWHNPPETLAREQMGSCLGGHRTTGLFQSLTNRRQDEETRRVLTNLSGGPGLCLRNHTINQNFKSSLVIPLSSYKP